MISKRDAQIRNVSGDMASSCENARRVAFRAKSDPPNRLQPPTSDNLLGLGRFHQAAHFYISGKPRTERFAVQGEYASITTVFFDITVSW
jgi:hypothetical protein